MSIRNQVQLPVTLLSLFAFSSCAAPVAQQSVDSQELIVGGSPVAENAQGAPRWSTVALTTDLPSSKDPSKGPLLEQGHSFCTATIISKTVVMTAAHCLQKMDNNTRQKLPELVLPKEENFLVFFGPKVGTTGKWIKAKKVIPHPEWDPNQTLSPAPTKPANDIGLIVLSEGIPEGYMPVQLARPTLSLKGKSVFLAGFGVSFNRNKNDTGILRQVQVTVQNADESTFRLGVGGEFFKGACAGDSGGPAYFKEGDTWMVVGATSTGAEIFGTCLGIVNNYTDARHYFNWIDATITDNGQEW